ncbi:MAG: chlororespiratory reduction protein 7, partial [Prochlorococcaceae cyanobacterium]
ALRAERLLATACELELAPGETIQWFAVRLEPPA